MGMKIKNINIKGLRGIKESLTLDINNKSVLLYGDNGTGKSSITDSVEWFYTDKVSHLSSMEIDLKESLRNSSLHESNVSSIQIVYNRSGFDVVKSLSYKKEKLTAEMSKLTKENEQYFLDSENENLLLRYQYLRDFIDNTKGEKLKTLSDIIGFSEVTKTKDILKKVFNSINSEIKTQNFEGQINTQKQTLIEKIGAAVSQEKHLFEKIDELTVPLKTGISIKSFEDIELVLDKIKSPVNTKQIEELRFLENTKDTVSTLEGEISLLNNEYNKYYGEFEKIAADVNSIMQIYLSELLKSGEIVLAKKFHKENSCPLCLQPKNIEELKKDLQRRLKEIEESSKKKVAFDNSKQSVTNIIKERLDRLDIRLRDTLINNPENISIKNAIDNLKIKLGKYQNAAKEKVTSGNKIPKPEDLILIESDFEIQKSIDKRIIEIQSAMKKDNSTEIYAKISSAIDAFKKIKSFENDKNKLELQKNSLEIIYNEFVKQQKDGLESFISAFSDTINEIYQYMNPNELFKEIRIVTIGEEDELNGLKIDFKYNDSWDSPPQKYFSESHLNCFGLSFFLASIIAFNKTNEFFILDDVISSFDTYHRQRFATLLFEKFSNYQIILLTHETEWFSYVRQLAKRNGWIVGEIKWSDTKGTHLEAEPKEKREIIASKIADGDINDLGNSIRTYLESVLKEICLNLEVKVSFKMNDVNEKRMPNELLNELISKIKKHGGQDLVSKVPIIERVSNSSLLGNLLSHDNPFNPRQGDIEAFWADIEEFRKIFYCQISSCSKPIISLKYYDNIEKRIRCSCGNTEYTWK